MIRLLPSFADAAPKVLCDGLCLRVSLLAGADSLTLLLPLLSHPLAVLRIHRVFAYDPLEYLASLLRAPVLRLALRGLLLRAPRPRSLHEPVRDLSELVEDLFSTFLGEYPRRTRQADVLRLYVRLDSLLDRPDVVVDGLREVSPPERIPEARLAAVDLSRPVEVRNQGTDPV